LENGVRNGRVMVVAAHPDDEVIGVGGQLAVWGSTAVLVHVTDGAPPDEGPARAAGFASRAEYAAARRRELGAALAWLPRPPAAVIRVGATDQRVTHDLYEITRSLARIVAAVEPMTILTHPYEGGHPDHDATAFAVAALRRASGFAHLEFACYHEAPGPALVTNRFAGDLTRATRIVLDGDVRRLKRLMLSTFRTQQQTLRAFSADEEWIRVAPVYDFTRPANDGRLWYERFDWGVNGREWRALAARAGHRLSREPLRC
jgi:LmbE family N-acetylglucosaminyl deacetylase